jgi:hypothetical protein
MSDYKRQLRGNIDDLFKRFNQEKKKDCFDYMVKRGKYEDDKQIAVDWGAL